VLAPMTVTTPAQFPSPEPSPPRFPQPVPVPTPEPALPPRPVSVASVGTRPTHNQGPIPPGVWIPVSNGDGIRLPPHEFSPQLAYPTTLPPQPQPPASVSPTPPPVKSPSHQPILMVRPPASDTHYSDRDSTTSGTSYSPATERHRSHHRKRRSSDSQASTTMSQMDILGSPNAGRDRERVLSSITEERSSAMASPNNTPSVRVSLSWRGYSWTVTNFCLRSPYSPTLISSRQMPPSPIHLPTAFLLSISTLPRVYTNHPQCPARSTTSVLSHRYVFLAHLLNGLVVYKYCSITVTSNFKRIL
jgi:hypothetical protein